MYPIRYAFCLLAFCIVATCTYGQQSYPKSLLWRISGKGLKHPSYLFGTIHLTDKRLFKLGDSVFNAIERTEGFAMEINPDEMGAWYINKAINEAEGAPLNELLDENDFKKYSTALAKKFKKPAAEITTRDIVAEKNKWMADYLEKGEMATFLDAYLYNIARRQGKWVGGVEDITDQAGLLDDLVDKTDIDMLLANDTSIIKRSANNMVERMINMYVNQDLTGIESITANQSAEYNDLLLIKRNVKMARRIDSLTALRTMFVAVGAAHLPGDSGVIHLLRARGFTVEPVYASQKIDAASYTFKEVKLPWTESEDKQGLYKVSMPGNAIDLKLFGFIDVKFLFDIFTLSNYCTMSVVSPRSNVNKDSMLQELAQRMFHTTGKIPAKNVNNGGIEGKEYIHTLMGQKIRMQAFLHDNIAYVAFMNAVKKEMLTSEDAERFFKSFTITKKQLVAEGDQAFTDSVMGISVITPAKLTYNKKLSVDSDGWHISAFAGVDMLNGRYVMLFSKDIYPGHYLSSDSTIQQGLVRSLHSQYPNLKVDSLNIQGYNAIMLKGANSEQPGIYMQALSVILNNRNVVLLVISDSAQMQKRETRKIFSSLRIIAPAALPWKVYTTGDSLFSARVPGPFRTWYSESSSYSYSFDTTTASSYYIMPDTLGKYTWFKNDSLFWANTASRFTGSNKLISKTSIRYNDQPALELLTKEDVAYKRMRLILHDDKVMQVMVIGDSNFVHSYNATEFLNSFRINTSQQQPDFITKSKTTLLLQDLSSPDSATRVDAAYSLMSIEFCKEDVSQLNEALFKQYDNLEGILDHNYVNMRLGMKLAALKDPSTISYIKEKYASLTGLNDDKRNTALATLAGFKTGESYNTLARLIDQYGAPKKEIDYQCIQSFNDSLALTVTIFNTLQKLAKDSAHCMQVAETINNLRDSGYINKVQLAPLQNDYIVNAKKLLPAVKKEEVTPWHINELLKLTASFNTTAGNAVLKSYLAVKDLYIKREAVIQLIKNKQQVPAGELLKLAADRQMRSYFYRSLKELKKTAMFPKQYATQPAFAEAAVHEIAADDYDVKKISFLTKKTAAYKGKTYTFYLYRVMLEDDEPAGYLGIAGGYKPGSVSLETAIDLSGVNWEATYSASKVNTQFKSFLKRMENAYEPE